MLDLFSLLLVLPDLVLESGFYGMVQGILELSVTIALVRDTFHVFVIHTALIPVRARAFA